MAKAITPRYFMMDCERPESMLLSNIQPVGKDDWFSGRRFRRQPQEPIVVSIQPGHEDRVMKEFFPAEMLMRADLVECLRNAGVDNLDVYDAIIRDKANGKDYTNYKAVNVIGVIAAADLKRTVFAPDNPTRMIAADIDSLAIDPDKTGGVLMFRLAQTVTGLVVHEKVKAAVDAADFPNMVFYEPEEWAG